MASEIPAELLQRLRQTYAMKRGDIILVEEAEKLRKHLGDLSEEMKKAFYDLLNFLADNDALTSNEVEGGLEQYEATYWEAKGEGYRTTRDKDVRSEIIRELTAWWVAQGNPVTKTLHHQNPTGCDSPVIRFICEEYKLVTGFGLEGVTARTELEKLGY